MSVLGQITQISGVISAMVVLGVDESCTAEIPVHHRPTAQLNQPDSARVAIVVLVNDPGVKSVQWRP